MRPSAAAPYYSAPRSDRPAPQSSAARRKLRHRDGSSRKRSSIRMPAPNASGKVSSGSLMAAIVRIVTSNRTVSPSTRFAWCVETVKTLPQRQPGRVFSTRREHALAVTPRSPVGRARLRLAGELCDDVGVCARGAPTPVTGAARQLQLATRAAHSVLRSTASSPYPRCAALDVAIARPTRRPRSRRPSSSPRSATLQGLSARSSRGPSRAAGLATPCRARRRSRRGSAPIARCLAARPGVQRQAPPEEGTLAGRRKEL
jgi:hypothetical protein